jgi:hypothetical protein
VADTSISKVKLFVNSEKVKIDKKEIGLLIEKKKKLPWKTPTRRTSKQTQSS